MHVRGFPGAHTLLQVPSGKEASDEDVQCAADLAAFFSKARAEGRAPVIVASPTDLKRPKGSRPGQVILKRALFPVQTISSWVRLDVCPWACRVLDLLSHLESQHCRQPAGQSKLLGCLANILSAFVSEDLCSLHEYFLTCCWFCMGHAMPCKGCRACHASLAGPALVRHIWMLEPVQRCSQDIRQCRFQTMPFWRAIPCIQALRLLSPLHPTGILPQISLK